MTRFECRRRAPPSKRTCIVTRAKAPPQEMIRFVASPEGLAVPDIRRKLPGRGVWVLSCSQVVEKAAQGETLSRGLKRKVSVSPNLAAEIERELKRDCLQALSLANKAGLVATGFAKAEAAIAAGNVCGFVHAGDGSAEGARKIGQLLRRRFGREEAKPVIDLFQSSDLDLALGQTNVIHAALAIGAAAEGFLDRCRRLMLYRSPAPEVSGLKGGGDKRSGMAGQRMAPPAKSERAGTRNG